MVRCVAGIYFHQQICQNCQKYKAVRGVALLPPRRKFGRSVEMMAKFERGFGNVPAALLFSLFVDSDHTILSLAEDIQRIFNAILLCLQENSHGEEANGENSHGESQGGSQSHLGVAGLRPAPSPAGSTGSRSDTPASNSGKREDL